MMVSKSFLLNESGFTDVDLHLLATQTTCKGSLAPSLGAGYCEDLEKVAIRVKLNCVLSGLIRIKSSSIRDGKVLRCETN